MRPGLPLNFFFTQICFFSRPGCVGLIMKNRVKSVFWSDNFISNFNVFNNIKTTLYYSVYMRASSEKVGYAYQKQNVFNRFHILVIRSLSGLYTVVCREGKRSTCLGLPLFRAPRQGISRVNIFHFWWKIYYTLI